MDADAMPSRLTAAGLHTCTPAWSLTPARTRRWPDLDLWFVVEGRGSVQTPEGRRTLRRGDCLLLRGGEAYTFASDPDHPITHYWAHYVYLGRDGRPTPHAALDLPPLHRRVADPATLAALLDRAIAARRAPGASAGRRGQRWFDAALLEIADADRRADRAQRAAPAPEPAWLGPVCRRLRDTAAPPPRMHDLAAGVGLSREQFGRVFHRCVGVSPKRYAIDARLARAQFLLRDSDFTVGQIAQALGYRDVYFFSRQFKQHTGQTPTACRYGL